MDDSNVFLYCYSQLMGLFLLHFDSKLFKDVKVGSVNVLFLLTKSNDKQKNNLNEVYVFHPPGFHHSHTHTVSS